MLLSELTGNFQKIFGEDGAIRLFFAPGSVNLIGEYTDYNGGHVLPFALARGIYAAVRERSDDIVRFAYGNGAAPEVRSFSVRDELVADREDERLNCLKGVLAAFKLRGEEIPRGFDVFISSDLPKWEGVFSNAPLEVAMGLVLRGLFEIPGIDELELAVLAQRAESQFLGHPCGIMEHLASAAGREGSAILLSSGRVKYEYLPLKLGGVKLVLTNSRVCRGDRRARDEKRREECAKALKKLQSVTNIHRLCDLAWDKFESCKDVIMDDVWTRRARHVVYEDARAIRAASALRVGNIRRLGELMNQSHISLRDDFEASCPELDFLVEQAWEVPGVIGSRMTRGGFEGATLSLVREEAVANFEEMIRKAYRARYGLEAEFCVIRTGDGARELTRDPAAK